MGQKQSVSLLAIYNKRRHLHKLRIDDKFFKLLRTTDPDTLYNGNPVLLHILMDYKLTITENIGLKLQLIEALLITGANPNAVHNRNGKNALILIADCKYGDIDRIKLLFILIEHGAIYKLNREMVYPTLYSLCCFLENPLYSIFAEDIFDKFIERCFDDTDLVIALMKQDIAAIKTIVATVSRKQQPTIAHT